MKIDNGIDVPSNNKARNPEVAAPIKDWINPRKEDIVPAISGNGLSAFAVVRGKTKEKPIIEIPIQPKNSIGLIGAIIVTNIIPRAPNIWTIPPSIIN